MEIDHYAPVVITTLNRYDHFKRCLESLERCTGADKTDVYIGLDYPPSEKFVEGWQQIDQYLKEKERKNGFRNLFVRRREYNCGVGKVGSNSNLLYREIRGVADRYITTEDDNEFAPCFLEYMNKALEKYKDNDKVICVCGYSPFESNGDSNIYFAKQMFAWGIGRWMNKSKAISEFRSLESMQSAISNVSTALKIYRYRPILLSRVMDQVISGKRYGDVSFSFLCIVYDRYCLYPSKTMVRNWGNDGTGVHCKKNDSERFEGQEINQETYFELDEIDVAEDSRNRDKIAAIATKNWYGDFAILLRYFIWRFVKIDVFSIRKAASARKKYLMNFIP